jgi:hypothetical protein
MIKAGASPLCTVSTKITVLGQEVSRIEAEAICRVLMRELGIQERAITGSPWSVGPYDIPPSRYVSEEEVIRRNRREAELRRQLESVFPTGNPLD